MQSKAHVAIIGGGVHGLSLAYNLAMQGVKDVVVFEKSYIGSGGSGRNAGGIRSQYSNKSNIMLANESLKLAERISSELNYNIMFRQGGYLYLAHTENQLETLRTSVKLQNSLGVKTRMVTPEDMHSIVPDLNTDGVIGGSYNNKDGISRHDAVVWGYARAAANLGVQIFQKTSVLKIKVEGGEVKSILTERGEFPSEFVVNAAGAHSLDLARDVGVKLPIFPAKRELFVTESLKPFLDPLVEDLETMAYFTQTDRGELLAATHVIREEKPAYDTTCTFFMLAKTAQQTLHYFPRLRNVTVLRQWAGTYDITPDGSPILGEVDNVKGFIQANGFSGAGFKLCFIVGKLLAELIITGRTPAMLQPYNLKRFSDGNLLLEMEGKTSEIPYYPA